MFAGEEILEKLIAGRVEPHIYAFSTNTIPNYLKIGDTYRPVNIRLKEWEKYFPELKKEFESSAKIDDVFFRDYAIHEFLENNLHKIRLLKDSKDFIDKNLYFSKEFFKDTKPDDIKIAINDILDDYSAKTNKYAFYNLDTLREESLHYERGEVWPIRKNQEDAVKNFVMAISKGRTNLLMYAVMRFGKSFTALCCAEKIPNVKLIAVVSAKADVLNEWRKNTEQPGNFANFEFKTSEDLKADEHLISNHIANHDDKVIVLFLTLQDLQGSLIKDKHKELFSEETNIDLLIIDETHFGARADKYGAVLRQPAGAVNKYDKEEIKDIEDYSKEINKTLKAKYKLHLSGTPYRILMGSEFQKDDIISFCQYSDIIDEQKKWDEENILEDIDKNDNPIKEWNNPYYGFPQMIRFAFNPNEASRRILERFKKDGNTYALSKLLEPKSVIKDTASNYHKRFVYEDEILELLEVIDGSKQDDEILSFLNYDRIIKGNMCRHIVMVLPYCASCDAMENLIIKNSDKFKNLNDYKIINISGIDEPNKYKDTETVKKAIRDCEEANQKTITLTVNRMLTGSTVEQWDTMIFLKDTASPQEYDQAIFRLQSQYVKTYKDKKTGDTIKYNMKPQTLLIDFCIERVFRMQELKAQIYNVNIDEAGNSKLEERIKKELSISPIIRINQDKIVQVEAKNILEAVSEYSKNRGAAQETNDIPVDLNLTKISEIWDIISKENELGSKSGFKIKAVEGEGNDLDFPEENDYSHDETDTSSKDTNVREYKTSKSDDSCRKDPVKQFRMYYARILYYSFLTNSKEVYSIDSIIESLDNENNKRIFKNLGLNIKVVKALRDNMDKFMLRILDYKIQNMNKLSNESDLEPLERANTANQKFGKIGESEVVTPEKITTKMIKLLPDEFLNECVKNKLPILDIASKEGEFAIALYQRFKQLNFELDDFKGLIYSIPTSSITYEFTRKIYKVLGLDINNIAEQFNSYDLLKIKKGNEIDYEEIKTIFMQEKQFSKITMQDKVQSGGDINMEKFAAIVGNPPYQENIGGALNKSLSKQLYPSFMMLAVEMNPEYAALITPSRWFSGNAQDRSFVKLREYIKNKNRIKNIVNYLNSGEAFDDVSISGGVNYFLYKKDYRGNVNFKEISNNKEESVSRPLFEEGLDIIIPINKMISIIRKVKNSKFISLESIVTGRNPFGIPANGRDLSNIIENNADSNNLQILCAYEEVKYINKKHITRNLDLVNGWKVFTSKMNGGAGTLLDGKPVSILGRTHVMGPKSICSNTLLAVGSFEQKDDAIRLNKYMHTKFFRFMLGIKKISQVLTSNIYTFVPLQNFTAESDIDWSRDIPEIDKQLYTKYSLSEDEITYIESMIKPMENMNITK